jgi:cytidine deaminase
MHDLVSAARAALAEAYAPYSEYPVGAALRTAEGTVYTGCNVENANFSNSLHAEEVAIGRAVAEGHRDFAALAVTSGARDGVTPCGMCRQTLAEFCDEDFPVYCDEGDGGEEVEVGADSESDTRVTTYRLGDLLPETISADNLGVQP